IPRPPNAFMLFRSNFVRNRMPKQERTTQMHISRLVADDWNALPVKQQAEWYRRAEMAKIQHERTFPGYRYIP
ncbi:high mobility group box domain-containing protein, partial [Mycena leptocephala]